MNDNGTPSANYDNDGASGVYSIAAGVGAEASGTNAIAMGTLAKAAGSDSTAIGTSTQASKDRTTALGHSAKATERNATAAGANALASGVRASAFGFGASATDSESTALGSAAQAFAGSATAVGFGARADQYGATAMGTNARAQGMYSTAVGQTAEATGENSVALGKGAKASHTDSVALGSLSETDTAVGTAGIMLNGSSYNFAGAVPVGTVSVGSVGNERTITNVAAGRISDTSTDAINGSQLHATNQAVGALSGSVGDLGDRAVKYDGIVGAAKDTITLQGTNGTKITNLADGVIAAGSKDAVNGGQIQTVGDSVAAGMGGGSTFVNGKLVTELNVGGASFSNVNDALGGVYNNLSTQLYDVGATAGAGWNVTDADNNSANIGPNGQVAFIGDQNVSVKQTGTKDKGQVEVTLNQDLKLNSITAVDMTSTGTVTANKVTANHIAINNGGPVINEAGIDMRDKQITGVAAGSAPSHAVNLGQLEGVRNDLHGEINNVRRDLHKVDRKLRAGVAAAMATAGLPQAYMPGKSMVAMGGGTWNGESGLALGVSKITDSGKWVFKVSGNASTRGDYGGTVGAGYQW